MGSFDEVTIDGRYFQTKALGKTLRMREVGDKAEVRRVARDAAEFEQGLTHPYPELPERYAVAAIEIDQANTVERHILISDGRIAGLADAADLVELEVFDYTGRSVNFEPVMENNPIRRRPRRQAAALRPSVGG